MTDEDKETKRQPDKDTRGKKTNRQEAKSKGARGKIRMQWKTKLRGRE